MERLISFNPISSKPSLPPLPRLSPLDFAASSRLKHGFSPPLTSADSRRFASIRCRYLDSSSPTSALASEFRHARSDNVSEPADLRDGSAPQPHLFQQIVGHVFNRQKVLTFGDLVVFYYLLMAIGIMDLICTFYFFC